MTCGLLDCSISEQDWPRITFGNEPTDKVVGSWDNDRNQPTSRLRIERIKIMVTANQQRFFFDHYGLTNHDLETYLAAALSAGGDYADLYFEYLDVHFH